MSNNYYNWEKIVSKMSDKDLFSIYNNKNIPIEDKRTVAINELINRNLIPKNSLNLEPQKFDKEIKYFAAELVKKGLSFDEIIAELIKKGIEKRNTEILVNRLKAWKKGQRTKIITFLILQALYLYFSSNNENYGVTLGIAAIFTIIAFLSFQLSAKKFSNKVIYKIENKENVENKL